MIDVGWISVIVCVLDLSGEETLKMPRKGKEVRPIISAGLSGKEFKRLFPTGRAIKLPAHPLIVVKDLQAGSLRSLDAYLKRNRGIPDSEVALELQKLLSGPAESTKFRLVVIDHPDGPPSKGGRPQSKTNEPSLVDQEIYAVYIEQLGLIRKRKEARYQTADIVRQSETTVRHAIRRVEAASLRDELIERRNLALERLRNEG